MNPEIVPALMPARKNYHDIEDHVHRVHDAVATVQLDIMDGVFVPEMTWPYHDTGYIQDTKWDELIAGDIGLPLWEDIDYELDLMVEHPEKHLDDWIALGPKRIIFHLESLENPVELLQNIQGIRSLIEVGLSVDNDTPVAELFPHLEMIDCVQLMGIARIGFQGEDFDERVLDRIRELKAHDPHVLIQIDGSVNSETIKLLADAGAERFVAGSAVWGAGDAHDAIDELSQNIVRE